MKTLKTLKKVLMAVVTVAVMFLLAAGCGRKEEPEPEKYWHEVGEYVPEIEKEDIDPSIDNWEIDEVSNFIPYSPEGWDGEEVILHKRYTDPNTGEEIIQEYVVAALTWEEAGDDPSYSAELEKDGISKCFQILCRQEKTTVLIHQHDGRKDYFPLDDLNIDEWYADVIDATDTRVVIKEENSIYFYNTEMKRIETVIDDCISSKVIEDGIMYTNFDNNEIFINWKSDEISATPTGEKVFRYWNENFELEYFDEDIQEEFLDVQCGSRKGYFVTGGNIYRDRDGAYIGNIHLPKACNKNYNLVYRDYFSAEEFAGLTEKEKVSIYRYGKELWSYQLPEGKWTIEDIHFGDTYREVHAMVLFNFGEKAIYTIIGDSLEKRCTEVEDYQVSYNYLYWMNSNSEAYELYWRDEDAASVLIGESVAGISHHTDEREGFLVKAGDPRANLGEHICSAYGPGWLNPEKTSASNMAWLNEK